MASTARGSVYAEESRERAPEPFDYALSRFLVIASSRYRKLEQEYA